MKLKIKYDTFIDEIDAEINNIKGDVYEHCSYFLVSFSEPGFPEGHITSSRLVDFDFSKYLSEKIKANAHYINSERHRLEFVFEYKKHRFSQRFIKNLDAQINLFATIQDWEILANNNMVVTCKPHSWVKDFESTLHST